MAVGFFHTGRSFLGKSLSLGLLLICWLMWACSFPSWSEIINGNRLLFLGGFRLGYQNGYVRIPTGTLGCIVIARIAWETGWSREWIDIFLQMADQAKISDGCVTARMDAKLIPVVEQCY
ncbi:hypothetical protein F5884DRAFT_799732 [Xylogone sp. PMI_703]|nr:hypothetical protein F5884DRAFT_799732 [Xylogone sp. PMI_703]